ncbi:hypothetical protein F4678DRAFT_456899 [Xylaria arbuscula]|nr:hypothetical protein F4678DRAFT_456899 [Xylaria arbuscula]
MKPSLEGMPIELIEEIVKYLLVSLKDVGSLRLTSRNIESKASRGCFARLFTQKTIYLSLRDLKKLVRMTSQSSLVCRLQHFRIKGQYRGFDEYVSVGTLTQFLTVAFQNLKKNSQTGSLVTLHLDAHAKLDDTALPHVNRDNWFTRCWATFRRMFEICMTALGWANLPVSEHLIIFGHPNGYPPCDGIHCSLEYDVFLAFAQNPVLMAVFNGVQRLTLSLSSPIYHKVADGVNWNNPPCGANKIPQSLHAAASLNAILRMSQLESLDFQWHDLGIAALSSRGQGATQPTTISLSAPRRLKHCILTGLWVSEEDFLRFLKTARPTALLMRHVRLIGGTYASSLKFLTGSGTPTEWYRLEKIMECCQMVAFRKLATLDFTITSGDVRDAGHKYIDYRLVEVKPPPDGVVLVPLPQLPPSSTPTEDAGGSVHYEVELNDGSTLTMDGSIAPTSNSILPSSYLPQQAPESHSVVLTPILELRRSGNMSAATMSSLMRATP